MIDNLNSNENDFNGNHHSEQKPPQFSARLLSKEVPLKIERYFTLNGKNPFVYDAEGNLIKWVSEDVTVTDDLGKVVFTQKAVRRPEFWSLLAIKIIASRYFWGDQAKNERENSIEQLIGRVSRYIGRQGFLQGYFNAEQAKILQDEIAAI